jgi:hypothetical protein
MYQHSAQVNLARLSLPSPTRDESSDSAPNRFKFTEALMLPSNEYIAHRLSLQKHELVKSGMSSLLLCSLVASVVHGQRPAKTMLYPVEAERDVYDRKSGPQPSIGLFTVPTVLHPEGQVPQMSIRISKQLFFLMARLLSLVGRLPWSKLLDHPAGDQTSMLRAICRGQPRGVN